MCLCMQDELIDEYPALGCMLVSASELSLTYHNLLSRFFGCAECRAHFLSQFEQRMHGLNELQPPAGSYRLSAWASATADSATPEALLEDFRSEGEAAAIFDPWKATAAEQDKLDSARLWLWKLHNSVSVRVAADSTLAYVQGQQEGRNYANCDTRWPPVDLCQGCRSGDAPQLGRISVPLLAARLKLKEQEAQEDHRQQPHHHAGSDGLESADFNEEAVLDLLRKTYWDSQFGGGSAGRDRDTPERRGSN